MFLISWTSIVFQSKGGAYQSAVPKSPPGSPLVPALPTNKRLGGKRKPETNTLAYWAHF